MNLKLNNRTITLLRGGYYCLDKLYKDTLKYTMYIHRTKHDAGAKLILI